MKIAIIGAGLAGLTLAHRLSDQYDIVVVEKARGPGGRMSTRRADPFAFDHGAQYFTAETARFQEFIDELKRKNLVSLWPENIKLTGGARISDKTKYAAQPSMNSICKALAKGLDVRAQIHVTGLIKQPDGWQIATSSGESLGPFDWVVSTAPADQTAALMPAGFAGQSTLSKVRMSGCFALMLGFDTPHHLPWQGLKSGTGPIGWMSVNSQKPGRPEAYSLLIQSANAWADRHLEDSADAVQTTMLQAASALVEIDLSVAEHRVLHRWRYASTPVPAGEPFLLDMDQRLAACGDWCLGSKVEAAFLSGSALAGEFLSLSKT
ncbi:MAG: FAD-dependent oxidoreductase [Pseudomonadota bacterium]